MIEPGSGMNAGATARPRRFGLTVGTALAGAGGLFAWQGVPRAAGALAAGGGILILGAFLLPAALRPLERAWTSAGAALGWLNTRILLGAAFALLVAPTGLALRLLGKDLLGSRRDPRRASYFEPRTARRFPPRSFERRF